MLVAKKTAAFQQKLKTFCKFRHFNRTEQVYPRMKSNLQRKLSITITVILGSLFLIVMCIM